MIKVKTFFLWIPTPLICVQSAEHQKPKAQSGGKYAPRGIIVIDGVVSVLKKILGCLYKHQVWNLFWKFEMLNKKDLPKLHTGQNLFCVS